MSALNERGRWLIVAVIGATTIALVLALNLFSRFGAADDLLDAVGPVFAEERVAGVRTGIEMFSPSADMGDATVDRQGGASEEAPKLIGLLAERTGSTPAQVQTLLAEEFPHTANHLAALPLGRASAEVPRLIEALSKQLEMSPEQLQEALAANFPGLAQAMKFMPPAIDRFRTIPGIETLTNFSGEQVNSVPQQRTLFKDELVPVLERQQGNYAKLNDYLPPVWIFPPLLLLLGLVLLALGVAMAVRIGKGRPAPRAPGWIVVASGVSLIGIVLGARMFPALNGGDDLIEDFRPVFADSRVQAYPAAITMAGNFTGLAAPITDDSGTLAAEVPQLFGFLAKELDAKPAKVAKDLAKNFPHLSALLKALPLSKVAAEQEKLGAFLAETLDATPQEVQASLQQNFPRTVVAIATLTDHVDRFGDLAGPEDGFTRFDGKPIDTLAQWQEYLRDDFVPTLVSQQSNFDDLDSGPPLKVFPPLLLAVGVVLALLGASLAFGKSGRRQ